MAGRDHAEKPVTSATAIVRCERVTHRYGKALALRDVSLSLPAGGMLGLIGPDGVGKSSLLGLISGSKHLQAGEVQVLGGSMRDAGFRRRVSPRLAFLPQGLGRNLYLALSVEDNIDFFARLFGQAPDERRQRLDELLAATGLSDFRKRPAGQLSGGMKQKLGLCCALVHDPDLLILDEPTTGVDPLSRQQFWDLIARIRARRPQMTVLVSTAYLAEAEQFEQIVALHDGQVLAQGSPRELCARVHCETLDDAFIALLPEAIRQRHQPFHIAPREAGDGEVAIEAQGLSKRFGRFTAVDDINLRVNRGEIFGFLGSNGCGKTTTIKMLCGLLPASSGSTRLFGRPLARGDLETLRRVGYVSQSFSLYGELSVRQNLQLHARLFRIEPAGLARRCDELIDQFDLAGHADALCSTLPLGIRQRLSLAVAVVHRPDVLILDEPTSGVDPIARDQFWALLARLARQDGVTIFISTHFMNEGERCDRVALMHAGRILACDTPARIGHSRSSASLEAAFVAYLSEAGAAGTQDGEAPEAPVALPASARPARMQGAVASLRRLAAHSRRETLELLRDPIRLTFALAGSIVLMLVLGFGISMDVENLRFAALDQDRSPESRDYLHDIAGSRYFVEQAPLRDSAEMESALSSARISVALEIPAGFGRDLRRGRPTEIGVYIDGAMPFRGEVIRGYLQGLHANWLANRITDNAVKATPPASLEMRYRYNQDFRSLDAMVPAVIPLLLVFVPSILIALSVVREKELGSITNLYVTPTRRFEFLIGKQLPYVAVSMLSFLVLVLQAIWVFGVPLTGDRPTLAVAALIYVIATTGIGLFISTFTRTQMAALVAAAVGTMVPATQFSGMVYPVASLDGVGTFIAEVFPTTHFLSISRGVFSKGLGFRDIGLELMPLLLFIPVITGLSTLLLRKQER